jgi:hypothetical protein
VVACFCVFKGILLSQGFLIPSLWLKDELVLTFCLCCCKLFVVTRANKFVASYLVLDLVAGAESVLCALRLYCIDKNGMMSHEKASAMQQMERITQITGVLCVWYMSVSHVTHTKWHDPTGHAMGSCRGTCHGAIPWEIFPWDFTTCWNITWCDPIVCATAQFHGTIPVPRDFMVQDPNPMESRGIGTRQVASPTGSHCAPSVRMKMQDSKVSPCCGTGANSAQKDCTTRLFILICCTTISSR